MNPLIQLKTATLLFLVALPCFALSPTAQAVSPPPDGGYPNRNTAEGDFALFSADVEVGNDNTAIGFSTLYSNVGSFNTAIGSEALFSNTFSHDNTATGSFALHTNTIGNENTATGATALLRNTIGNANTATGVAALQSNTTGEFNTATGVAALVSNRTANNNTANGYGALSDNTIGSDNTALGFEALLNNTTGGANTATGSAALASNTIGNNNTANGEAALFNNTIGNNNSATAVNALSNNTSGNNNTANGFEALFNNTTGNANTAYGFRALRNTTGSRNIGLGGGAGSNLTTGDNNIVIGNSGFAADSNRIRIGTIGTQTDTFIAGIRGAAVQNGLPVVVGGQGKLGTLPSSVRFKEAIKPMDNASEAILALKPVTFRYKNQTNSMPQFGLVAEDVAEVNPDLVVRDETGEIYTVRYEAVNAMLLNEFLKEHRKNEEQEARIARQQKQIEALTAGLQKVSAQLEASKPAPQVVENNR
jgi:hypothetical protein